MPLHIEIGPSLRLRLAVVIFHLALCASAFYVPFSVWVLPLVILLSGWSIHHIADRHAAFSGVRAVLERDREGTWWLDDAPLSLFSHSYLWPGLLLLRFGAAGGQTRTILLPADGIDQEVYRRLRVRLRCTRSVAPEDT